jgi:hypothetical protein
MEALLVIEMHTLHVLHIEISMSSEAPRFLVYLRCFANTWTS